MSPFPSSDRFLLGGLLLGHYNKDGSFDDGGESQLWKGNAGGSLTRAVLNNNVMAEHFLREINGVSDWGRSYAPYREFDDPITGALRSASAALNGGADWLATQIEVAAVNSPIARVPVLGPMVGAQVGFNAQMIRTAAGMVDVPGHLVSLHDDIGGYADAGLNGWDSAVNVVGRRVPVLSSVVSGYESYDGRSSAGADLGRSLSGTERWQKGLAAGGEVALAATPFAGRGGVVSAPQTIAAVEGMGARGQFVNNLSHLTGKTAAARNRAIDTVLAEDLSSLRLTHRPQYSPYVPYAMAKDGVGTHIGPNSFISRAQLRNSIVHEELHHRWWARKTKIYDHHPLGSAKEAKFYETIRRYEKMRGWKE